MSRSVWAVVLAAILGLVSLESGWRKSNPSGFATSPTLGEEYSVLGNFPPNVGVSEKRTASQFLWRSAGRTGATKSLPKGLLQSVTAATSGTVSVKLQDIPVGKVIQVGQVKFVKVGADQYLAINLCPDGSTYSSYYKGCVIKTTTYSYTGNYQTFTAPATGTYVVELWGAQGGYIPNGFARSYSQASYVRGQTLLSANVKLYFYLGQQGDSLAIRNARDGFNAVLSCTGAIFGGGATDVRLSSGSWNDTASLRSRVIVAAGAGGGGWGGTGGVGGGISGYDGKTGSASAGGANYAGKGATQISGGSKASSGGSNGTFGMAGCSNGGTAGTGGGGWYGGGGAYGKGGTDHGSAGSGTSYISGHTGCVAVTSTSSSSPKSGCTTGTTNNSCSITPYVNPATGSGYTFTNTVMIDGAGYAWTNVKGSLQQMPSPTSVGAYYDSGVGHTGNGAARITQLSVYLGI